MKKEHKPETDVWFYSLPRELKERYRKLFDSKVIYTGRLRTCGICGKQFYFTNHRNEHYKTVHKMKGTP